MITVAMAMSVPRGITQSYDSYKSWFVVCDNTLTCVAKGFADEYRGSEIKITRQGGPAGKLTVTLSADHRFRLDDIRIDGKPARLSSHGWRMTAADDQTSATSSDFGAIRSLVLQLHDASKVSLGSDGDVPLDGFAAAILRLDSRQGRLDGVTSLARPGALPASGVSSAPPLPKIPVHPIRISLARGEEKRLIAAVLDGQKAIFAKEECDEQPKSIVPEAHALDGRQALVLVPCLRGAYQGSSLAFMVPRGGGPAKRLVASTPYLGNDPDKSDVSFFTEATFDPSTGTLSMAAKGRGLADCGMSASWIWDGRTFILSEMALQQACGGVAPGDWPILFRSGR